MELGQCVADVTKLICNHNNDFRVAEKSAQVAGAPFSGSLTAENAAYDPKICLGWHCAQAPYRPSDLDFLLRRYCRGTSGDPHESLLWLTERLSV